MGYYDNDFCKLDGQILTDIKIINDDVIMFKTSTGTNYKMWHVADCCECVTIDEIIGDLSDLLNTPILLAEIATSSDTLPGFEHRDNEHFTWTFYKLSSIRGSVTIRWYGSSNGYYSEAVSFSELQPEDVYAI